MSFRSKNWLHLFLLYHTLNFTFQGMSLWWPDSVSELTFVRSAFPAPSNNTIRHLGLREVTELSGILTSDFTISVGIPGITQNSDGSIKALVAEQSFMVEAGTGCLVYDFSAGDLAVQDPCPEAKPVCKAKIGRYYIYFLFNTSLITVVELEAKRRNV